MAETTQIKVFYHVVRGDHVDLSTRYVRIDQNKKIPDLRKAIATKEAVPEEFITVWKPDHPCPREPKKFKELFEEHDKLLGNFCEDITEDPDTVLESLDAPSAKLWVVVVTVKPLEVLYHLVDTFDPTSHTVSVSPNANVCQLRQRIATKQQVRERDVQIWRPRHSLAPSELERLFARDPDRPQPLEITGCKNLTDKLHTPMSDVFNLAQSDASDLTALVVTVKPLQLRYHMLSGRAFDSTSHTVWISPNADVDELRRRIATKQKVREREVQILKPRQEFPLSELERRLSQHADNPQPPPTTDFENLTDNLRRTVSGIFSLAQSNDLYPTTLVVTIPKRVSLQYHIIIDGKPLPTSHIAQVSQDDNVDDLRWRIAMTENIAQEDIAIFKPYEKIANRPQAFTSLCDQHNNDPTKFCTILADAPDTTCAELLELKNKTRVTSQPVLVVMAWVLPKRESHTNNDEAEEARDTVGELKTRFMKFLSSKVDSPSSAAVFANYIDHQNSDMTILDGRYADRNPGCAPPITLFHPVFARFVARTRGGTLPPLVVASTSEDDPTSTDTDESSSADAESVLPSPESALDDFLTDTSEFVYSASRLVVLEQARDNIQGHFKALFDRPVAKLVNQNRTSADYTMSHNVGVSIAALAVVEIKADLGLGNSDPAVQGMFSYVHHWKEQEELLERSFCPSFVIASAGPYIAVCGAIWTADVIYQCLTPYIWVGYDRTINTVHFLCVARLLYALRLALDELQEWYSMAHAERIPRGIDMKKRIFPMATRCVLRDGTTVNFEYKRPFKRASTLDPGCVAFLVVRDDTREQAVVKFVERYSKEAHDLLAENNHAPKLLSIGPVWVDDKVAQRGCDGRQMLMMEYVEGTPCMELYNLRPIPEHIVSQVRDALALLHENGMVHGDIRRRNIIVEEGTDRVKIVDFDWAGKVGKTRYPLDLNRAFPWPKSVNAGRLIRTEHDDEMCARLSTDEGDW